MAHAVVPERRLAPLDPFVIDFLTWLANHPAGFAPTIDGTAVAAALDWPPSFVQVIFLNTRTRRLIAPAVRVAQRGPTRWTITDQGRRWLAEITR